jgi:hypothetical protein
LHICYSKERARMRARCFLNVTKWLELRVARRPTQIMWQRCGVGRRSATKNKMTEV